MRRALAGSLLAVAHAAGVAHALPVSGPGLKLVGLTPLTVRGTQFKPHERVD
jgi:hypothetical protein